MATKEEKNVSGSSLVEKQRSGILKNRSTGFGLGMFGSARFDETTGYETTKEGKKQAGGTLEAKP